MKVLVTGGAGYIGSTICSALIDSGHVPVILDSLITGRREFTKGRIFYQGDIADQKLLEKIFEEHPDIKHTIHCAALIVVPESVQDPYEYYKENVAKSLEMFYMLNKLGCKNIIFSSSASIYEDVPGFKVSEEAQLNARSPYARTKYMMEMILKDFCTAYGMRAIVLRYFNPIGADPQMRSGIHVQFPSHVLGKLVEVAIGNEKVFKITGVNWNTRDGSGIRDFVHVWDLALAHVKAVEKFEEAFDESSEKDNYAVINLGTGSGVTIKELVKAFESVYGKEINKEEAPPRLGDVAGSYASIDKAKKILNWEPTMSIEQGIEDALKWTEIRKKVIRF